MKKDIPFPPQSFDDLISFVQRLVDLFTAAEIMFAVIFILIAALAPRLGMRTFERIERSFSGLANHPVRQIMLVGLLAIICRAALLPWLGVPIPAVYDEQSMALQAQTFMAGRLANPTPHFWEHFEVYYVNMVPAYASMYFPGRGAPLFAGLLLAGNAWIGVWLSMVLMCMAATWMLQGWISGQMAFLGGVLVTLRIGVFSFWVNSFYGGAFTAVGALLAFGALPRILDKPGWLNGIVMALGISILMISRPYEGALLCLPLGAAVLIRWISPGWKAGRLALIKVAVPVALLVGASGGFLLAYNAATTGEILKSPYTVHRETYAEAPAFLTSPPFVSEERGPPYFRTYYETEADAYHARESAARLVRSVLSKTFYTFNFYIGATLFIAFLAGLWASRRNWILIGTLAFFFVGYCFVTWNFPQYTAPVFPVLLVLMMRGFEWLRACNPARHPAGLFLSRAMATSAIVLVALPTSSVISGTPRLPGTFQSVCCAINFDKIRPALIQKILAIPGRDLVFVKDGLHNPSNYELVFNEPDIDKAKIVWAHRLGAEKDSQLQNYFSDRNVWEVEWLDDLKKDYRLKLLRQVKPAD